MRAMEYRGPYRVRVDEKPMPEIEHPRDAIVRVTSTAMADARPPPHFGIGTSPTSFGTL